MRGRSQARLLPASFAPVSHRLYRWNCGRRGRLATDASSKVLAANGLGWHLLCSSKPEDGHQDDGDDSSFHPDATSDGSSSESSESSTEDNLDDHSLPVVNMPRVLTFVAQFVWALVVILLMQVVVAIVSGYYVTSESAIAIFLKNHNFITEDTADWMEEKMQVYDVHSAVDFLAVSTSCRRPPHVSSFFVVAEELLIGNCPGAIGALVVRLSLADDRSLVGACSLPSRSVHNDISSIALHHF
jgi:hypothetical protein